MAEFNVRADEVNVEQIMHQIRARIRERRGVDYTEEQIQELAKIKLEKFLDPRGVRSDLLEQFQRAAAKDLPTTYEFDGQTLIRSGNPLVAFLRRLLQPVLKLFFSPNALVQALHYQTQINRYLLERAARDVLVYEVMHNLVVEMTRTGIEVKNMKMRVESIAGRLDFNERRARALEAVVQYKPESHGGRGPQGGRGQGGRVPAEGQGGRASGAEGSPSARGEQGGRGVPAEGQGGRASGAEGSPSARGEQGGRSFAPEGQGGAPSARGDQGASAIDPMTGGESLRSRRRRRRRGRRSGPGFGSDTRSDERRATSDELERRTTSDEPEPRTTSDEPEPRTTSDELEPRTTSDELEPRTTSDELEPRTTNGELDHGAPSEEPRASGAEDSAREARARAASDDAATDEPPAHEPDSEPDQS